MQPLNFLVSLLCLTGCRTVFLEGRLLMNTRLKYLAGICAACVFAVTAQAGTGCGDCGGCASGSGCVGGGVATGGGGMAAGCVVGYETQTVMRNQWTTETRMVPYTTYQRQAQTRMRNVTRRVARVRDPSADLHRERSSSSNANRDLQRSGVCPLHRRGPVHGSGAGDHCRLNRVTKSRFPTPKWSSRPTRCVFPRPAK